MTAATELANPERLTVWLDAHIPELGTGPLKVEQLHGGTSNVILTLDRGGPRDMVLRRPPAVAPPGAEKGVLREARVLTARRRRRASRSSGLASGCRRRRSAPVLVTRRTMTEVKPRRAKKRLASRLCVGTLLTMTSEQLRSAWSTTASSSARATP